MWFKLQSNINGLCRIVVYVTEYWNFRFIPFSIFTICITTKGMFAMNIIEQNKAKIRNLILILNSYSK